jgi:hypothetical protein
LAVSIRGAETVSNILNLRAQWRDLKLKLKRKITIQTLTFNPFHTMHKIMYLDTLVLPVQILHPRR